MTKFYRRSLILIALLGLSLAGWGVYSMMYNKNLKNDILLTDVDTKVFRPYVLGTEITFNKGGNSLDFINKDDGWGGQEPKHRCAVGKETILRLYIPDGMGASLRLSLDGFGVFQPKKETYQKVTIYANDIEVGVWHVGHDGPFNIDIPSSVMTDNTLTIKFVPEKPYSPPPDTRKISMAVYSIKIDRVLGAQTKRKIGKWVKENLMDGGVKQNYDTSISDDEMD